MKAEVIYISALYLGEAGKGVEISEVREVLLFECSLPDQVAVAIFYNKFDTIVLKKGDIKTCFHDAKTNLISFDLYKPLEIEILNGNSCQTLTLQLDQGGNPMMKSHHSDYYLFLDFTLRNFHGVDLKLMKNAKEFSRVIETKERFKKLLSPRDNPHDIKFIFYLRCYVYFLNHNLVTERRYKKFIRSQENLPAFLKDILGFEDHGQIVEAVQMFIFCNICRSCRRPTHKKCSVCRMAHYCGIECQTLSWAGHETTCKTELDTRKMHEKSEETILNQLTKQFSTNIDFVSMKVFQQELEMALFVLISPLVEETNVLDHWAIKLFKGVHKSVWLVALNSLLKKEYVTMRKKLNASKVQLQMSAAWNKDYNKEVD